MKALSVKSPHAQRIAIGRKTLEIRSRRTHYRGDLLICVSKRASAGLRDYHGAYLGHAICVAELYDCRAMLPGDEADACHPFLPGQFVWKLRNVRIIRPFPVKGQLSMFDVDDSLIHYRRTLEERLSFPRTEFPPSQFTESRSSFALA